MGSARRGTNNYLSISESNPGIYNKYDFTYFQNNDTVHNYNNLNLVMNDGAAKDGRWLN